MNMKLLVTWFFLLLLKDVSYAEKVFLFQKDNQPTVNSWAKLNISLAQDPLRTFSICSWTKVLFFRKSPYVFSYATSDKDNNELNYSIRTTYLLLAIGGKYIRTPKTLMITPKEWVHSCYVINETRGTSTIYVNGEMIIESGFTARDIFLNGSFVIGQETDLFNGGFQAEQSFSGYFTGLQIFRRAISVFEVEKLAGCSSSIQGDILSWNIDDWQLNGTAEVVDIFDDEICGIKRKQLLRFIDNMNFPAADSLCKKVKGSVATPYTEEDNDYLYSQYESFAEECKPPNSATTFMWIGATDRDTEGSWTDLKGNALNFTNFGGTGVTNSQDCAGYDIPPNTGQWNDVSCTSLNFCVPCHIDDKYVLQMRGLCEDDVKSTYFFFDQHDYNNKYNIAGYTKYSISLGADNQTWLLFNAWDSVLVASWFSHQSLYPLGLQEWILNSDYDICGLTKDTKKKLSLSACPSTEYTCGEGSCIPLNMRCDLRVDCPDSSDEEGCEKLILPTEYLKTLPPPSIDEGEPLKVNLSVVVRGFAGINLIDMQLTMDLVLEMKWIDQRLSYKNLKPSQDLNSIDIENVWYPEYELMNADFPNIETSKPVLTIERNSEPLTDDISLEIRDEIYSGDRNSLVLKQKVNAPFFCDMDLLNFPFDTQMCTLHFSLSSSSISYAIWDKLTVNYTGNKFLTEYEVKKMNIRKEVNEFDNSEAIVDVVLDRRYAFYITSAYLPTLMLMFIGYVSLFCKKENIDLRVMLAITTLLVLYALYQQIANGLPRTSYTKAIDYWCFYSIIYIFFLVIANVFFGYNASWFSRYCTSSQKVGDKNSFPFENDEGKKDCQYYCRFIFVVAFLVFMVIYIIVVYSGMIDAEGIDDH